MRLIFIPRPAPTGARNRGYRRWFRQEPSGVSRGTGSPWKCAESLRHTQRDMRLIFIPRPAPTGARNRGYRRWFRQEPSGVSRGTGSPWKCAGFLRHTQRDMRLISIPRPAPTGARNRGYRRRFRQEPGGVSRGTGSPWKCAEFFRHAQSGFGDNRSGAAAFFSILWFGVFTAPFPEPPAPAPQGTGGPPGFYRQQDGSCSIASVPRRCRRCQTAESRTAHKRRRCGHYGFPKR